MDFSLLHSYGVSRNYVIVMVVRICGGATGTRKPEASASYKEVGGSRNPMGESSGFKNPRKLVSFKDVVKGKASIVVD